MLSAGSKFGKYTVVRTLGKGGMGAVYLVRHDVLDAYFALKVLAADVAARNAQFIPRFLREAKLCCRIRHPNLVSVHDAGRDEATGLHYLVMDYAPGGNLREMLDAAGGPLDRPRALKIMRELASALVTASEFDLVHRDIKPENIMFGPSGEAKLADLGIAKAADDRTLVTMENAVFGTPAYMSPEQAYDSGKVDARADIYSLGIVFFEMLSGRRPYDGSSSMNIIAKVLSREPVPDVRSFAPDVPEDIAAVVRDMCVKDASKRIPTARALLARLDEIAGAKTYVAHSKGKKAVDAVTVLSVVGAVVALTIVGAFAWGYVKSRTVQTAERHVAEEKGSPSPQAVEAPVVQENVDATPPADGMPVAQSEGAMPPQETTVAPENVERPKVETPPKVEGPAMPEKPAYTPLRPATVIHQKRPQRRKVEFPPLPAADPVEPGKAVVLGGEEDDAVAVKARLGVDSFQSAGNSAQLADQIDGICAKNPSRVYIKLGSAAAQNRMAKDIFDNRIRSVADRLRDKGVDFQFVLEDDSEAARPYNDVIREVCNQKSYEIFGAGAKGGR